MSEFSVLYRGPLESCNYDCPYCPFAKVHETHAALEPDRRGLARFVEWVGRNAAHRFGILFTPWGEALVRSWYRDAMAELSRLPNVRRVAAQTNLSFDPTLMGRCDSVVTAFWATYHPGEVREADFLARVLALRRMGFRLSVGAVGLAEHLPAIESLRAALPADVYLWINAVKSRPGHDADELARRFEAIDPLFPINRIRHPSLGRACRAGATSFTVDGDGLIRRCHFVGDILGSINDPEWTACLQERFCPNETCGCHIGYVNLDHLGLDRVFGDGLLERIPADFERAPA
jgi:MoaA/NifB/PqqE/SkfB family radical SAM enzyme